jgi:hypothetical protein
MLVDPSQPLTPQSTNQTREQAIASSKPKETPKASPNPSKATSPANIRTTFGVPKKQR